ncbi:MAG: hypothetical protein WAW41_18430 [Methylobacter sp.]
MNNRLLSELDYSEIIDHYNHRVEISHCLKSLLAASQIQDYVDLALGIADPYGNYSAAEHGLGPRILNERPYETIFKLATKLSIVQSAREMRNDIYKSNVPYLKVGVGTEMAMLLQPDRHWVANTRSIWSHLVMRHRSIATANKALRLYREGSDESKMAYDMWCAAHEDMELDFTNLAAGGAEQAHAQGIQPGSITYLWADAVANALYERHGG